MNLSALARYEVLFLLGGVVSYLVAMLLLWSQLFFSSETESPDSETRNRSLGVARTLLCIGASLHLIALVQQGAPLFTVRAGVAGLFGWILVVAYLIIGQRLGHRTIGAFVTPVALLAALYSLTAPLLHKATPRSVPLEESWLIIHVVLILMGYVALAFAFASCLIYLLQEALLKRKRLTGLWQRLPSLQVADDLICRATSFGLALLTIGILTGVIWQQWHQPNYAVLRDPKVIFSLLTWVMFAGYLAARLGLGWRGRRTNLVVVYGFLLLVISFFGTPHILSGVAR